MANIVCFPWKPSKGKLPDSIPPDGVCYFVIGPDPIYGKGTVTVTACVTGVAEPGKVGYIEVVQMATRTEIGYGHVDHYLDCVVKNNSHKGTANGSTITSFDVFVSVITP